MNEQDSSIFTLDNATEYSSLFCSYLQSHNREALQETLLQLRIRLNPADIPYYESKLMLIEILLDIKQSLLCRYEAVGIPFCDNYSIIKTILHAEYTHEIIDFFDDQFELIMSYLSSSSNGKVVYDILHYINHNYHDNIQLSTLAELFGYNSSYLGKLFTKRIGTSFNAYLDYVRISHSKILLLQQDVKVYIIAEQVGYKSVDYFHQKFKTNTGMTPLEFRKKYT
ncbi:MAG: AraC family transcriptional regulator [bacterium]|nr:AraC family transcriptional regulator [bacterium]